MGTGSDTLTAKRNPKKCIRSEDDTVRNRLGKLRETINNIRLELLGSPGPPIETSKGEHPEPAGFLSEVEGMLQRYSSRLVDIQATVDEVLRSVSTTNSPPTG